MIACETYTGNQGPYSIYNCCLTSIGNPIAEVRQSLNHIVYTIGFSIETTSLYWNQAQSPSWSPYSASLNFKGYFVTLFSVAENIEGC